MKVGFITQWYDPETGSAAIPGSIVRALESQGHRVEVVTGYPNYPTGRVYPGYRIRPFARERRGKTIVTRVAIFPSHDDSGVKRALTYLAFMVSASTIGAFFLRRVDVVLVYSTSATVGVAGVMTKLLFRRRYVLYIEDLWPDSVMASGMVPGNVVGPATRVLSAVCALGYRNASRIAVISPGMKKLLVERGVNQDKIDVVYNWVDEEVFRPVPSRGNDRDTFEVMYAGSLGEVQGLEVAVEAISRLADLPQVKLRFIGAGVAERGLRSLVIERGLTERVSFEGIKRVDDMAEVMATADVQLVCLRDIPLFHATMPSKTQAILACGQPVVVSAPGDVASLVVAAGAGLAAAPGDPDALAAAIRDIYARSIPERQAMGRRGREFYMSELSASVGSRRLSRCLEESQSKART